MKVRMRQWKKIVDRNDDGKTLEQLLKDEGFSRKEISRLKFKNPGLTVDGRQCRSTAKLCAGQEICLYLEDEKTDIQKNVPLEEPEICYEDEDLLIVNKPSGLSCHPGRGHYRDNLGSRIQNYCREKGETCAIRLIGRLDKDTSGLVVFAKNQAASARLWKQREDSIFQKTYCVLVHGFFEKKNGVIDVPLGADPDRKNRMKVITDGKAAVTCYQVVHEFVCEDQEWKECFDDRKKNVEMPEISLVKCLLKTGRTHQIRVHMASLGHPVLGDPFYGKEDTAERLWLHAATVELVQPFTGKRIKIEVPMGGISEYIKNNGASFRD